MYWFVYGNMPAWRTIRLCSTMSFLKAAKSRIA